MTIIVNQKPQFDRVQIKENEPYALRKYTGHVMVVHSAIVLNIMTALTMLCSIYTSVDCMFPRSRDFPNNHRIGNNANVDIRDFIT